MAIAEIPGNYPGIEGLSPDMPGFLPKLKQFRKIRVSLIDSNNLESGVLIEERERKDQTQREPIPNPLAITPDQIDSGAKWLDSAFEAIYGKHKTVPGDTMRLLVDLGYVDDAFKAVQGEYNRHKALMAAKTLSSGEPLA